MNTGFTGVKLFLQKNFHRIEKNPLCFCALVLFFKHERKRKRNRQAHRSTGTNRGGLAQPLSGQSNDCPPQRDGENRRENQAARKINLATELKIRENKNMNITKVDLYDAIIQARVALSKDIREMLKDRTGILAPFTRNTLREKIAAYRLLSNLAEINARTYTHNKRDLQRVKKALAK